MSHLLIVREFNRAVVTVVASHRVEAVNQSVSVSSWFADTHIASILRQSAEMPLLPMLPALAHGALDSLAEIKPREGSTLIDEANVTDSSKQALAVAVAAIHRLLEGFCGKDVFSRVMVQRYTPVYGALARHDHQQENPATTQELAAWRDLCSPERRAIALQQFGAENVAAVDATIAAKKALFAELVAADSMNDKDAAGITSEMMLDEAELTVALLLGDASLLRFFHACTNQALAN